MVGMDDEVALWMDESLVGYIRVGGNVLRCAAQASIFAYINASSQNHNVHP